MLHAALLERGIKRAIHCQHRQKAIEQGFDLHLAERSAKYTHVHREQKQGHGRFRGRPDNALTLAKHSPKKKRRKKASVKNILVLHYKPEENPVISLHSNFSQSKGNRQKNKSTERDKVSRWL